MARRITFGKLIAAIRKDVPRLDSADFAAELVADIVTKVWNAQDFRETLGQLPPFFLVGDVQDYGPPVFIVPADFQSLKQAVLKHISWSTTEAQVETYPLKVKTRQDATKGYSQRPEIVSYEPSENCFRIYPLLPRDSAVNEWLVEGVYKKIPQTNIYDTTNIIGIPVLTSDITPSNYHQLLLPLDDRYYSIMKDIAVMLAKKMAGGINDDTMKVEAYIDGKLRKIAVEEGLDLGSANVTPAEALMDDPTGQWISFPR